MGPDEKNTTKSVTFDEENNIVREFSKHQKIEKGRPPKFQKDPAKEGGKQVAMNAEEKDGKAAKNAAGSGPKGKKQKKDRKNQGSKMDVIDTPSNTAAAG